MSNGYVLEMNHITKHYGENCVLRDVSLRVKPGEIVALIGENGAGKSTLMNILFGMPVIKSSGGFKGELLFDGKPVEIASPIEATKLGIGMVHQEFMLVDNFTVAENVKLNREVGKKTPVSRLFGREQELIDRKKTQKECKKVLDALGISLDESARIATLPVGYKQFVEIARELDKERIKLLVLDEPSAVLNESEAEIFLNCVHDIAKRGVAIIFISHRLNEIKKNADTVCILKDGEIVGEYPAADISIERMSELMIGREVVVHEASERNEDASGQTLIELKNFSVDMPGEEAKQIDLEIKQGEILGIAGLSGHGKVAIANGIMGIYPTGGEVRYRGEILDVSDTYATLQKGIAFVSEDRRGAGLLMDKDIAMNIAISAHYVQKRFIKRFLGIPVYDEKEAVRYAGELIRSFGIKCSGWRQHVGRLSGGNQQKVCIARALAMKPTVLMVSEPTRGIDVGAKKMILDYLLRLSREEGVTVVITSSELAELRSIADRIAVVTEGRVVGILKPQDENYRYGMLMSGISEENGEEEA